MKLWENMRERDAEHIDTASMKAIRTGLNIRDDFWNDFLQVCNNSEAVAELLGVRIDQVSGWGHRVKHNLEKVRNADTAGEGEEKLGMKTLTTGNDASSNSAERSSVPD